MIGRSANRKLVRNGRSRGILISTNNHLVETNLEARLRGGVAFAKSQDDEAPLA
jgi:hypothetical protein